MKSEIAECCSEESKRLKSVSEKLVPLVNQLKVLSDEIKLTNIHEKRVLRHLEKGLFNCVGVYVISIDNDDDFKILTEHQVDYRAIMKKKGTKVSMPKPNSKHHGRVLYVGKIDSNDTVANRLKQHLVGGQHDGTSGLRLLEWLPKDINLKSKKLSLTVYKFEKEDADLIRHFEKALWTAYKPIFGKK